MGLFYAIFFTLKTPRKAGGRQIPRWQGLAVDYYGGALAALTLAPSDFCNDGVNIKIMGKSKHVKPDSAWRKTLTRLCDLLIQESIIFFPIRHHSPACSWHLKTILQTKQPASILVEGPESLSSYIPDLSNPDLVAPVALYSQYIDAQGHTLAPAQDAETADPQHDKPEKKTPPRFNAYYPLCDYSPELVAIREGKKMGAKVQFCDLDYGKQVIAEHHHEIGGKPKVGSLFDERHLAHNRYLCELARRTGCRDTNELWDRLFESDFCGSDTAAFMAKVATYCFFARMNTEESDLLRDGTIARESRMLEIIKRERQRLKRRKANGPLLVVTGGFHTPALVLKRVKPKYDKLPDLDEKNILHAIIPYSYHQLDALNGYAAGMPSPTYYQKIWKSAQRHGKADLEAVSRSILVQLPQKTREKDLAQTLSTADAISANQLACSLARFRGNPGPMREDILDGIRSSFVKGALDAEGEVILALTRELLCGDAVGSLPAGVRSHPLLEDFRLQAGKLNLNLSSSAPRPLALKIYKKEKHRQISIFLRSLQFLDIPFGRFSGGPDFITGTNLELQTEHWNYSWRPQTDSALVERSLNGATLQEAMLNRLRERQADLENEGAEAGIAAAVSLLLICCRLGLHSYAEELVPFIYVQIQKESSFVSSVNAIIQMDQLYRFKSPMETRRLETLPVIIERIYARCCYLLSALGQSPKAHQEKTLQSLPGLYDFITAHSPDNNDSTQIAPALMWDTIETVLKTARLEPQLTGGLIGMRFNRGKCSNQDILSAIELQNQSSDAEGNCLARFLAGLFVFCRELTWNDSSFMEKIDTMLTGWENDEFYRALPDLRRAFAEHTPQETHRTGKLLAQIHSADELPDHYNREMDEAFVMRCSGIAAGVARSLKRDRLQTFK